MIISDLSVLEVVEAAEVLGGTFVRPTPGFRYDKNINANVNTTTSFTSNVNVQDVFKKDANIKVVSDVKGNSSTFAFDNEAAGKNTNTQGTLNQLTIAGEYSGQNGLFVSAAN
ncbi:hypothetical protein NIES3974_20550 [Calothrix sp. NIES-3974]|nr:hypothetical protein NIES3974_20550 [Calothrix sp. NIES-3974]